MERAISKGSLSFGLVNIPIALHPAEKSEELSGKSETGGRPEEVSRNARRTAHLRRRQAH